MDNSGGKSRNYIIGASLGLLIYLCFKSVIVQYGVPNMLPVSSTVMAANYVTPLQPLLSTSANETSQLLHVQHRVAEYDAPPTIPKSQYDTATAAPVPMVPEPTSGVEPMMKLTARQMIATTGSPTTATADTHTIPLLEGKNLKDQKVLSGVCNEWKQKFMLAPGLSWGTMPLKLQRKWDELKCDHAIRSASFGDAQTDAADNLIDPSGPAKWCANTRDKHKVVPMKSWGTLSAQDMVNWKKHRCDVIFTRNRIVQRPISSCGDGNSSVNIEESGSFPLIAIMAGSTTRKIPHPSVKSLSLFNYLLPSIARTLDCGYRYVFVLGYDQGDEFYDSSMGMSAVRKWFEENIEQPLKQHGISIKFSSTSINNSLKKPGPIFNAMARYAHTEHSPEYYYRLNDDTELLTNWPSIFVKSLRTLTPPYGVVGPFCEQGNTAILTHDFVHKTHMSIFDQSYYPPQLTDWWMDDWISFVYGKKRTFRAMRVKVIHHTSVHGQRYTVEREHEKLLGGLLEDGKKKIHRWMSKHDVPSNILTAFDTDVFKKFRHQDVPL